MIRILSKTSLVILLGLLILPPPCWAKEVNFRMHVTNDSNYQWSFVGTIDSPNLTIDGDAQGDDILENRKRSEPEFIGDPTSGSLAWSVIYSTVNAPHKSVCYFEIRVERVPYLDDLKNLKNYQLTKLAGINDQNCLINNIQAHRGGLPGMGSVDRVNFHVTLNTVS